MTKKTKMTTWDGGALGSMSSDATKNTKVFFLVFWATRMKDIWLGR